MWLSEKNDYQFVTISVFDNYQFLTLPDYQLLKNSVFDDYQLWDVTKSVFDNYQFISVFDNYQKMFAFDNYQLINVKLLVYIEMWNFQEIPVFDECYMFDKFDNYYLRKLERCLFKRSEDVTISLRSSPIIHSFTSLTRFNRRKNKTFISRSGGQ